MISIDSSENDSHVLRCVPNGTDLRSRCIPDGTESGDGASRSFPSDAGAMPPKLRGLGRSPKDARRPEPTLVSVVPSFRSEVRVTVPVQRPGLRGVQRNRSERAGAPDS